MSNVCLCKKGSRCDRVSPPNLGTGIFNDKSIELFRNADLFLRRHLEENPGRVFVSRLAMRNCFVLCSNSLVKEFLTEHNEDYYNGLKDFFFGLFGESILFADHVEATELRRSIMPLFSKDVLDKYDGYLKDSLRFWIENHLSGGEDVEMYSKFKHLALSFHLKVFLGVDEAVAPEFFSQIVELTTTHWHGIISVPLNIKLSFLMSSGYRRAAEAKDELLKIIGDRIQMNSVPFLNDLKATGMDLELAKNHVLIFMCALIPKASASILANLIDVSHLWYTKFVDESGTIEDSSLEAILLEVIRLWPPFIGGLRVATCDTVLGEYHVPKGFGVFNVTMMAHRDPEVFPYPEEFMPERWTTFNQDDRDKLFGFGAGVHRCVGERLMWKYLMEVGKTFIKSFEWEKKKETDWQKKVKYLPVSRPAVLKGIPLKRRTLNADTTQ